MTPTALMARIEEAGLNASAPPQQLLFDGWLVRFSPGKAKRARSANAISAGYLSLAEKIDYLRRLYRGHDLPPLIRITPFSQPADLDTQLQAQGWNKLDDTRVMVADLQEMKSQPAISMRLSSQKWLETLMDTAPSPFKLERPDVISFADIAGTLRNSPAQQRRAHAQRLAASPVPFEPFALTDARGHGVACGQIAREGELVGLYDIVVREDLRQQGIGAALTAQMLAAAIEHGARTAYLQMDADNTAARAIYQKMGFADAYGYWYRVPADIDVKE